MHALHAIAPTRCVLQLVRASVLAPVRVSL